MTFLLYSVVAGDQYYQRFMLTYFIVVAFILFYTIIINGKKDELLTKVAHIYIYTSIFVGIMAIRILIVYPHVSRHLGTGNMDLFLEYSKHGAVGYDYVYGFVILSPVILGHILDKSIKKRTRLILVLSFYS